MTGAVTRGQRAELRDLAGGDVTAVGLLGRRLDGPDGVAVLQTPDGTFSAAALLDETARRASALADRGTVAGDRVAIIDGNTLDFVATLLACGYLGAVAVPVNTAFRGRQLSSLLALAHPRVVLVGDEVLPALGSAGHERPYLAMSALRADRHGGQASRAVVDSDQVAVLIATSGTTGASKLVECSHTQLFWWGLLGAEQLELRRGDRLFSCLPLFHVNALATLLEALLVDGTAVFERRFSASNFWRQLSDSGARVTYLLGAMTSILLSRPPDPAERAHRAEVALAPATPAPVHARFPERFGMELIDGYGQTETNAVIGARLGQGRPGWMGRLGADFDADVVDERDRSVGDGQAGELVLRPHRPFTFASGYFADAQATVSAGRNLWWHTGDRVVRDGEWFRFVGRRQDAIRRRGENISTYEVEQAVLEHGSVGNAVAFGVPSPEGEEEVMVVVVPVDGQDVDPLELVRFLEPRLAYFAIPRFIETTKAVPATATGKPLRTQLRERGVSADTWDLSRSGYRPARPPR